MMHWKLSLAVPVAVLVLAASCCCCCSPGGSVEFTGGDFADVPTYPGATQTTEDVPVFGGVASFFALIMPGEEEWKHYTTSNSELDVLSWYDDTLPDYGWSAYSNSDNSNGLVFVKEGEPDVMLVVFVMADTASNVTHIIVGRSQP